MPSLEDIKDGLLKMILFTNLEDVKTDDRSLNPVAVLKLTVENHFLVVILIQIMIRVDIGVPLPGEQVEGKAEQDTKLKLLLAKFMMKFGWGRKKPLKDY